MKNNFIIAGSMFALVVLAITLISLTLAPPTTEVSHSMQREYHWYFKPTEDGSQPIVADDADFLSKYRTISLGNPEEKTLYLTFDCGYENGYMPKILDVLKEKNVPATFFIVGHYLNSQPELVNRMVQEGHIVGNHTLHHANLAETTSVDAFSKEVLGLADAFKATTGKEMPKYLRPPEGTYSEQMLQMAEQLGYTTVFWSFAYKDWLVDAQPNSKESLELILKRTHPGAVILLHSTSETNAAILGDLIDAWKAQGYEIKSLDEFPIGKNAVSSQSAAPDTAP